MGRQWPQPPRRKGGTYQYVDQSTGRASQVRGLIPDSRKCRRRRRRRRRCFPSAVCLRSAVGRSFSQSVGRSVGRTVGRSVGMYACVCLSVVLAVCLLSSGHWFGQLTWLLGSAVVVAAFLLLACGGPNGLATLASRERDSSEQSEESCPRLLPVLLHIRAADVDFRFSATIRSSLRVLQRIGIPSLPRSTRVVTSSAEMSTGMPFGLACVEASAGLHAHACLAWACRLMRPRSACAAACGWVSGRREVSAASALSRMAGAKPPSVACKAHHFPCSQAIEGIGLAKKVFLLNQLIPMVQTHVVVAPWSLMLQRR